MGVPFGDLRLPIIGSGSGLDASGLDASSLGGSGVGGSGLGASGLDTSFGGVPFDPAALQFVPASSADSSPFSASAMEPAPLQISALASFELPAAHDGLIRQLGGVAFDPYRARRDFPILDEQVHGKRLVWLDNAATTQKPLAVIERLSEFYKHENSNIHRAAHTLAARATDAYEKARETTRQFLNASSTNEIIFVRGATEGINLVAQTWGRRNVNAGDEIVITHLEHHANIVPWQQLCAEKGARLRVAPVDDRGDIILEQYEKLLTNGKTKLVALPQVSNALGTITPAREMVEMAHRYGARVLVDGAQAVSHMKVDVQLLDCDFYVFSGHKVFAPTGIGAVFGKRDVLDAMPPWQGGGNMIQDVTFEKTTYQAAPFRFEAGTGNIADAAGMGAALEYVMQIGMDTIDRYEHSLLLYATDRLAHVPGLRMIGTSPNKAGVLSFVLDGQRTEDVGAALDQEGIAVRSGHHCAQPILRRFGVEATVRASLAFYNVCEDVDALIDALMRMQAGHFAR
jgi:cysteine desulfurase/selenocysteine lyase